LLTQRAWSRRSSHPNEAPYSQSHSHRTHGG
jgi:hypothetical protein